MKIVKKYNNLHNKEIKRSVLTNLLKISDNAEVTNRLTSILVNNPDTDLFILNIKNPILETKSIKPVVHSNLGLSGAKFKTLKEAKKQKVKKPTKPNQSLNGVTNTNSLASKIQFFQNKNFVYYEIQNKSVSAFLGDVEIKEKESVVITVAGDKGSGKTRFVFQLMDIFGRNYKVGHASMEEHPESALYWGKVHEYISSESLNNIENPEVKSINQLDSLIQRNDVIIIDSFAKIKEIERHFEIDKDLRKKYNGKLFIVIFQQTSDGKMRGGSKSGYDGDIILFSEKYEDYTKNYIWQDKNRYQNKALNNLKYSIYNRKLI